MKKYVIVTDSCCDLPIELANELELIVLPLKFIIDDKTYNHYLDNRELDIKEYYAQILAGLKPTTSHVNPKEYYDAIKPYLKKGYDVLNLVFSSSLSATFSSAQIAIAELKEEFADAKILSVDTKSASSGFGLLVYLTALKKQEGLSIDEAYQYAQNLVPHVAHLVMVSDLSHLSRGGRGPADGKKVSKSQHFNPIFVLDNDGKLAPRAKTRGRKKAVLDLIKLMQAKILPGKQQVINIFHADDLDLAEKLAKAIKGKFDVDKIIISHIGPVIGAHTGPGAIILSYLAGER